MIRPTAPLALLFLAACTGPEKDAPEDTDTGSDTGSDLPEGCVVVDGGRGYATITDALSQAAEGSTIAVCAGTWSEALVIDKSVTLEGGDGVILEGPSNTVPLTISAADVTVRGFTIGSTRAAIALDGADNARLEAVTVTGAGSWGLTSINSTGVVIADTTFASTPSGGADVQAGSVTFERVTFDAPDSFGIQSADADLVLVDTVISGVTMLTEDVSDGIALSTSGGTLEVTGGSIAGAQGIGLLADGGSVTLTDVSFTDAGYLSIFAFPEVFVASGLTTTGGALNGAYVAASQATVTDSSFVGDPAMSCRLTYEEWGASGNPWCGGLLLAADTIAVSNVAAGGWNNYGLFFSSLNEDVATATVDGATVTDVGGWGIGADGVEGTFTGVSVSGTREPELDDPCGGFSYLDWTSAALRSRNSTLVLDGASLDANAGFGIMNITGSLTISGSTFNRTTCSGLFDFSSATTLTGNTFTGGSSWGHAYAYQDVLVIDGNTFADNHATQGYSYDYEFSAQYTGDAATTRYQPYFGFWNGASGWMDNARMTVTVGRRTYDEGTDWTGSDADGDGYFDTIDFTSAPSDGAQITFTYLWPYSSAYTNGAQDILAYEPGELVVTNNVFSEGDNGIYSSGGTVLVTGNTWTAYEGTLFNMYYGDESDPPLFADNTVDDVGGSVVSTVGGAVEIDNVTVGTHRTSTSTSTVYYDGVLYASYEYTSYDAAFYSYGFTDSPASLSISDTTIDATAYTTIDATDTALDLEDVTIGAASTGAVAADWSAFAAECEIEGLTIASVTGTALSFTNANTDTGYVTLDGVEVGSATGTALSATGLRSIDVRDASFEEAGSDGVVIASGYSFYDYTLGTYRSENFATASTLTDVTVGSVGGDGVYAEGGAPTWSGVSVASAGEDGVEIAGAESVSLSELTVASAESRGVRLSDSFTLYDYGTGLTLTYTGAMAATLDGVSVRGAGVLGIDVSGGSVVLQNSSGSESGVDGVQLVNTTATVTGNAFTANGGYGMTCSDVTLTSCSANDLSGNALGEHFGCDDACSAF